MATSWLTARAAIKTILEGVAIATPVAATIAKVYDTPPKNIADYPSFVIVDAAREVVRGNGQRKKTYAVRLRLAVRDADLNRATEILDAFEEAAIEAFDQKLRLGLADNYHVMAGPNWEEKQLIDESAGAPVRGVDGILFVLLSDTVSFAS